MAEKRMDPKKVPINRAKAQSSGSAGNVIKWIIAIAIFYVLTAATVSSSIQEVTKQIEQRYTVQEPQIVEKLVTTTKYRTEKTPFGEPRCEQMNYNFSYTYDYSERAVDGGQKIGTCKFTVLNQEDIAGDFTFYAQFFKGGSVSDAPDQKKHIDASSTAVYTWETQVPISQPLSCLLQINNPPHRMKCFYLEPVTYQIKEVPYTVQELKNITDYVSVEKSRLITTKVNETVNTYTNKYLGYHQFFYFGY